MKESPIFVRTYDLLQWLLQATGNFPKSQRFVMAKRIQETAFDFQEALLEAGLRSGETRTESLTQADIALSKLRFYLRLSMELTWLTAGQFEHASRMVDEIGRLLGGWQRKLRE